MSANKRRRSSPFDPLDSVKRPYDIVQREYGDIHISGSADVQLGDRIYLGNEESSLQQEAQRFQNSLYFPGMYERYESLQEAADNTYQWILKPDHGEAPSCRNEKMARYFRWFQDDTGAFWISGKPGSGKSTLMKYLVEHTTSGLAEGIAAPLTIFSFFFWIGGSDLQRNRTGCMRSLIWQALQNTSTRKMTIHVCQSQFQGVWTERILRSTLTALLKNVQTPVAIFLDGLDEGNDHDDILNFIGIITSMPQVKLCVSSRPETTLIGALQSCASLRLQDLTHKDIQHVIQTTFLDDVRVRTLSQRVGSDTRYKALLRLSKSIESKADGVFLWVILVIKDLLRGITHKDDLSSLFSRLERLPEDLHLLYQDMLRRANPDFEIYKDEAAKYLSLVLHREFGLIEFCFAINEDLRSEYLNSSVFQRGTSPTNLIDCETVMTWICTRTAGLLAVDKWSVRQRLISPDALELGLYIDETCGSFQYYRVRFTHRTAHDFLQNTSQGQSMWRSAISGTSIAQICYEVMLIRHVVLPCLQGDLIDTTKAISLIDCVTCTQEVSYNYFKKQGQHMIDLLRSEGILRPDTSYWTVKRGSSYYDGIFPSSKHANMDILPVLVRIGKYTMVRMWLATYDYMSDGVYLTMLVLCLLQPLKYFNLIEPGFWELLQTLLNGGANLRQDVTIHTGELISPLGIVLMNLPRLIHGSSRENIEKIYRRLHLSQDDLLTKFGPSCADCQMILYRSETLGSHRESFEFWGVFSAPEVTRIGDFEQLRYEDRDLYSGLSSKEDRILVMASYLSSDCPHESREKYPQLWAISAPDSQRLRTGIKQKHWVTCDPLAPGICAVRLDALTKTHPNVKTETQPLRRTVNKIRAESQTLTFVAAMERLGKSRETIMNFYKEETERMKFKRSSYLEGWEQWYWGYEVPGTMPNEDPSPSSPQ